MPASDLTHVQLIFRAKQIEHWIRFGEVVEETIQSRRRCLVDFAPGSIFAFVRWAANDYGTIVSRIDIVQAVAPGETFSTVPGVTPGGTILLRTNGWPKVEKVLCAIDAVEALGINAADAAPDHWRHVHHRLLTGEPLISYSRARHAAWLKRRSVES